MQLPWFRWLMCVCALAWAALAAEEQSWRVVGQVGGPVRCVAVQGTRVWAGVGMRVVELDVSNPAVIREAGATPAFPHVVEDVAAGGTLAYVAAGDAGLRVVDISNPPVMTAVGAWNSRGYAEGVAIAGSVAYLADGPYGLRVIDVSKPAQPVEVGSAYALNYAYHVAVQGRYAYIAGAGAGLLIADVSDPGHPAEVGALPTFGHAYDVAVAGNVAYVADGWEGLKVVNVADPAHPSELAVYKTPGWAMGVKVSEGMAYVADAFGGLRVVDVSTPSHPVSAAYAELPRGHAGRVAVGNSVAYVVDENFGLRALSLSGGPALTQVGSYRPIGYADAVAVAGNYASVAAGNSGLGVIDISDPTRPRQVGGLVLEGYARDVVMEGKFAYLVTMGPRVPSALHVVDLSDPSHPVRAGFSDCPGGGRGLYVAGGIAYIAVETGLQMLSVADPAHPVCIGYLQTKTRETDPETTSGVTVEGKTAYVVADSAGLITVDVSDPTKPVRLGTHTTGTDMHFNEVAVAGNRAYIADTSFGLRVLDVAVPAHPVAMGSLQFPGPQGVVIAGNLAYVAVGDAGLMVADVSDPNRPALVGTFRSRDYARQVAVAGERVLLADGPSGLLILERTTGTAAPSMAVASATPLTFPLPASHSGWHTTPSLRLASNPEPLGTTAGLAATTNCLVTSAGDSGDGTLRWCLGNASSGTTITFDPAVFPPAPPTTIHLLSGLPGLGAGNITIDASESGVILDGSGLSMPPPGQGNGAGLSVMSDGNRVMGLQVLRFPGNGIELLGSHNFIGGDRTRGSGPTGQGNVISGNGQNGISINHGFGTTASNTVVGNLIGTDASGTRALGNKDNGVLILGAEDNRIGGLDPHEGNVVSSNGFLGFYLGSGATRSVIAGNLVGTDASGSQRMGNLGGISIVDGSFANVIQGNLVSGNYGPGIAIGDALSSYNAILGNMIGTDATGTRAIPNDGSGIGVGWMGATFNRIGGTRPGEGNLVSGNKGGGISVMSQDNLVRGNYVGTDITGRKALGNGGGGVGLSGGRSIVGGVTSQEANIISGNGWFGVSVESDDNVVAGNFIGTDPADQATTGNVAGGVMIHGQHTVLQANIIANTATTLQNGGGDGVSLGSQSNTTIRRNRIHGNAASGIGGNPGVAAPVISSVGIGSVSGTACPGCEVEIFSDAEDEGGVFEGSVVADAAGFFAFQIDRFLAGPFVTATATDPSGITSAFSPPRAAPPQPPRRRAARH